MRSLLNKRRSLQPPQSFVTSIDVHHSFHFPLFQLAHIHIAAPEMINRTAIIISAYLSSEGTPTVLPQGQAES